MSSPQSESLTSAAGSAVSSGSNAALDHRFYPHIVDLVFDFCAASASSGDWAALLLWRQVSRQWSERADGALFAHVSLSSCGVGDLRPVLRAPAEAGMTRALPILPSALGPASPWDAAWRRSRARLLSRLQHVRVVDLLSPARFSPAVRPFTDATDANLASAISRVHTVRRPFPAPSPVRAGTTVDVLEFSNELEDDPAPFGQICGVASAYRPHAGDGRASPVAAVLVVRIRRDWIREPVAELQLDAYGAYMAPRVHSVTVIFDVEEPDEEDDGEYEKGDQDAALPRLAGLIEWLWRPHEPLTLVGLDGADARAFGLAPGADVVYAVQHFFASLEADNSGRPTPATFLSRDQYRRQVGPETFELHTSLERRAYTNRPDAPFQPEPEETVPRLVARSLWRARAGSEDRRAALAMRAVSRRWCWDVDSVLFRHVVLETRDRGEMPSETERKAFMKRLVALTDLGDDDDTEMSEEGSDGEEEEPVGDTSAADGSSSANPSQTAGEVMAVDEGDTALPPKTPDHIGHYESDADVEENARLLGIEADAAILSIVSPAGRLPLLSEFWSIAPTPAGLRAHAKSMERLHHSRFVDVAASEADVQWAFVERLLEPSSLPLVRVVRHTGGASGTSRNAGNTDNTNAAEAWDDGAETPRSAAELLVYVCDGTPAAPCRAQTAPACSGLVQALEPRCEVGSMPSVTLNVLFDPEHPRALRETVYSAHHWEEYSTNALTVLFTPVRTPAHLSSAQPKEPEESLRLKGPEDPRGMPFFAAFWLSVLGHRDRSPVSIAVVGLERVPRAALGLRADVAQHDVHDMVCWNLMGAITREYMPDLTPPDMAAMAEEAMRAVKFYSLQEYRNEVGRGGWDEVELERGARPAYWPAGA